MNRYFLIRIRKNLCKSLWVQLLLLFVVGIFVYYTFAYAENEEDWMPDPALRQLVRETLELPNNVPLTQLEIKRLTQLIQYKSDIQKLTGLEHATSLERLEIYGSHITDLFPIKDLTNLTRLGIAWNRTQLSDISSLAKLTNLIILDLNANAISDITVLAGLTKLETLKLHFNVISDVTPLAGLTNLIHLDVSVNPISDLSPVLHVPNLLPMLDIVWELPKKSIEDRLADRIRPSTFAAFVLGAWGTTIYTPALNLPQTDVYEEGLQRLGLYDLYFVGASYHENLNGSWRLEINEKYSEVFRDVQTYNDNMIFLAGILMRGANYRDLPADYPYWLRDVNGKRVQDSDYPDTYLLDFTQEGMQQDMIEQAVTVSESGLFDGIFFDWWHENGVILADSKTTWGIGEDDGYRGFTAEQTARDKILKGIRERVPDDFLILVNTNRNKIPRTSWGINGTFMETGRDHEFGFPDGYTHEGIEQIEDTLRWSEKNMRYPQINCLEGWGNPKELPDSPQNRKNMRLFTTMHLTHSDGFVLYTDGVQHDHYWYPFWDTELGKPVSKKSVPYEETEGLYIREFTNGWAVYNRSGKAQEISLPIQTTGVASGITSFKHTVPDLDGEMYLKTEVTADVNGDGVVNIQDLVIVANAFGEAKPDLNGDDVVNIQDLVIVANAF